MESDPMADILPTRPARSGRTGQRPFGSLGDPIEVERYDEIFEKKVATVKEQLAMIPRPDKAKIFKSLSTGSQHRAGPLAVQRPNALRQSYGIFLEFSMWEPVARAHSILDPSQEPIFSMLISGAIEAMRRMPIVLDAEAAECSEEADWECVDVSPSDIEPTEWGKVIGHGLRSVQFHSTLSGELIVCLAYYDPRVQSLKRGEVLPEEDGETFETSSQGRAWLAAAAEFKALLQRDVEAVGIEGEGAKVDVIGRWKRRHLQLGRDFVMESFTLADGRTLVYKQPEGQFSNPNPSCEVHCLNWLCQEAKEAGRVARQARRSPVLLELHCGGGNNTVAVAPGFGEVRAVEINKKLAEAAEENLKTNKITNTHVIRADCADIDASVYRGCDVVLVDPPRAGLDEKTRTVVSQMGQILYISCNPLALASDLEYLGEGYEVVSLAIFDMFPYTSHIECAVRIRRIQKAVRPHVDPLVWSKWAKFLVIMVLSGAGGALWAVVRKRFRKR